MNDNLFFKPTPLYKEFMILNLIEKNNEITQREIGISIGIAVSMVNNYLNEYELMGLIKRERVTKKNVKYYITKKGSERKKVLNIMYLSSSLKVFKSASENIIEFLLQLYKNGFRKILLYGAGEVAEILLQTLFVDATTGIRIIGIIDDDITKQNQKLCGINVLPFESIKLIDFDGILVSSYTNRKIILEKLKKNDFENNKIIHFFD